MGRWNMVREGLPGKVTAEQRLKTRPKICGGTCVGGGQRARSEGQRPDEVNF